MSDRIAQLLQRSVVASARQLRRGFRAGDRGHTRRDGRCLCGRALASHYGSRNQFITCDRLKGQRALRHA